jgi:hypothetical protein
MFRKGLTAYYLDVCARLAEDIMSACRFTLASL